jgi:type I restriction enzyme R subunit
VKTKLKLIENLMVERMADNDKIVTRYMDDKEFGDAAFTVLSKAIYESIPSDDSR